MTHSSINRIDVGTTDSTLNELAKVGYYVPSGTSFLSLLILVHHAFLSLVHMYVPHTIFQHCLFPSVQFYVYSPSSHVPASILTVTFHGILSLLSQTSQILRMLFPPTSSIYHSPTYRETCALWESVGQEKA